NLDLRTSKDTPQPPFAHWWDALSTFMVQPIVGDNSDWKEYHANLRNGYREPDGTGTSVWPLLGHNRINLQGTGYAVEVYRDDFDLTVEAAPFDFSQPLPEANFTKNRFQPVPTGAIDVLKRATNNRGLVYAALLMTHQSLLRTAMTKVPLTTLSSGVA